MPSTHFLAFFALGCFCHLSPILTATTCLQKENMQKHPMHVPTQLQIPPIHRDVKEHYPHQGKGGYHGLQRRQQYGKDRSYAL